MKKAEWTLVPPGPASGVLESRGRGKNGDSNKLSPEDRPAHDWYRFVLSFPPHLVRDYVQRFRLTPNHRVLDPFCGTGTTIVECKKLGIPSVGIEANPMAVFASQVKTDWSVDPDALEAHAQEIADPARRRLRLSGVSDDGTGILGLSVRGKSPLQLLKLPEESEKVLLADSISPLPLHKTLVLLDQIRKKQDQRFHRHELLALAKALVTRISNLHFGPEVGVRSPKSDAPVIGPWAEGVLAIAADIRGLQARKDVEARVHYFDSRRETEALPPNSIDAVITSPPYPNEKDYTRTTRLESVLLGFIRNKQELKAFKKSLMRSNTRNVFKDDDDDIWIAGHPEVQRLAEAIESRRITLGKTSGFERLYARVTKLYFGGMTRHLSALRKCLRRGAKLAYVVGDQASYLRVMIRTGAILGQIAESLGYELLGVDLFRTRLATATREQLREEVVILRWPG